MVSSVLTNHVAPKRPRAGSPDRGDDSSPSLLVRPALRRGRSPDRHSGVQNNSKLLPPMAIKTEFTSAEVRGSFLTFLHTLQLSGISLFVSFMIRALGALGYLFWCLSSFHRCTASLCIMLNWVRVPFSCNLVGSFQQQSSSAAPEWDQSVLDIKAEHPQGHEMVHGRSPSPPYDFFGFTLEDLYR